MFYLAYKSYNRYRITKIYEFIDIKFALNSD